VVHADGRSIHELKGCHVGFGYTYHSPRLGAVDTT
jgi:hypothetical protein